MVSNNTKYYHDPTYKAAIYIHKADEYSVKKWGASEGMVWVRVGEITFLSCYKSPNCQIEAFQDFMDDLGANIRRADSKVVIGGDFNAKSEVWGATKTDRRGDIMLDKIYELDLAILNQGSVPTYRRGGHSSLIDVTLSTPNLANRIRDWQVDDVAENLSDHNYIFFDIDYASQSRNPPKRNTTRRWKVTPENLRRLSEKAKALTHTQGNKQEESLTNAVISLCESTLKKSKAPSRKNAVHWWNDEIRDTRRDCIIARRRATRANARRNITEAERLERRAEYNDKRKQLRYAITKSKKLAWEKLLEEVDSNMWGLGYKIVTGKLHKSTRPIPDKEVTQEQIAKLFPTYPIERRRDIEVSEPAGSITNEDVIKAVTKAKSGKAPGIDGIPAEAIKAIAETNVQYLTNCYNEQWDMNNFPYSWKKAKLLLIEKPKKDDGPPSYRPICLLSCVGKVYESLINDKLCDEIDRGEGLYKWQYGFRKGMSTTHAIQKVSEIVEEVNSVSYTVRGFCIMVTLDVKNAFNSIKWQAILEELDRRKVSNKLQKILQCYLSDRLVEADNNITFRASCGVPQGSVLGPTLWNIAYDTVLKQEVPNGVSMVAFADDLALVIKGKDAENIQIKTKQTIEIIRRQLDALGLQLADQKTNVVILAGRQKLQNITIQTDVGTQINSQSSVNYLGVHMEKDNKMTKHVTETLAKVDRQIAALTRLMPNIKGPKSSKRRIYASVSISTMLYAAPAWSKVWCIKKYEGMMERRNRTLALRVLCAYRTTSLEAALVLAALPPIKLLAEERKNIFEGMPRLLAKSQTRRKWQERWEQSKKSWTKRLIPNLDKWLDREVSKIELDHFSTQILTGHEVFAAYKLRIGKAVSEKCWFCDADKDDPEHTMFVCDKWSAERNGLFEDVGKILSPENVVETMLDKEENWIKIVNFMTTIMKERAAYERERDKQGADATLT